jgi:hypothetical protein
MENIQSKLWFSGPFVPLFGSKILKKMLLQMTSGFLQLESTIGIFVLIALKATLPTSNTHSVTSVSRSNRM